MNYYYNCKCGNKTILETDEVAPQTIKCYLCNEIVSMIKKEMKMVEVKRKK